MASAKPSLLDHVKIFFAMVFPYSTELSKTFAGVLSANSELKADSRESIFSLFASLAAGIKLLSVSAIAAFALAGQYKTGNLRFEVTSVSIMLVATER